MGSREIILIIFGLFTCGLGIVWTKDTLQNIIMKFILMLGGAYCICYVLVFSGIMHITIG